MNTASLQENQALHAIAAAAAAATATASIAAIVAPYELHLIPLSRLRPSSRNVRKSGGTSVPELAASNEKDAVMRRTDA
jgi:ParB family chromosome partitioning protein